MKLVARVVTLLALLALCLAPRAARADVLPDPPRPPPRPSAPAADPASAPQILVYTIGVGDYLFAKFGHTAICVAPPGAAPGAARCYDFGVADPPDDLVGMVYGAMRGVANFAVVGVDEAVLVKVFSDQGRSVERQRLRLSDDQARAIAAALEGKLATREHYAYHPKTSNCTSYVRDVIDQATGGKLHEGEAPTSGPTFREMFETGVSGEVLILTTMALALGPMETRPTTWEQQAFPPHLRDSLRDKLGANVETVHAPGGMRLPTSRHVGRFVVIVVGLALALTMLVKRRRGDEAKLVRNTTIVLASLGALLWIACALTAYTELRYTWSLFVFLPTDALLLHLRPAAKKRYLEARLASVAFLALASIVGVVHQPVWAAAMLVLLPLGAMWALPRIAPKRKAAPRGASRVTARA